MKSAAAEAMAALTLASGSGDEGRAAAWANVPEVFITFAVSFAFLEFRTSRIDVDGGEVFDGVAAQALHSDLRWDLGAEQDLDLERGWMLFVLHAEGLFPISSFAPVIASNVSGYFPWKLRGSSIMLTMRWGL
jgi:hypothetical protein